MSDTTPRSSRTSRWTRSTIGASGDDDEEAPGHARARDPGRRTSLAAIYPTSRRRSANATEAARAALESPVDGPRFSELLAGKRERRRDHRQPVPADPVVEAASARARRDRGRRQVGDVVVLREREGLPDVRVGHRAEDRQGQPRPHGAPRDRPFHQNDPRNADDYTYVGVSSRGTPVWLHKEVARLRRQDHDRPGAVEPLGRRRRRQADPPRRRLRRDDRVEPLRVRPVAADALRRVRRADALGHRRGRDDVRPRLHDERRARHARPRDRVHLRLAPRGAPQGDRALQRDLRLRAPRSRQADIAICGVFAPDRPPVLPHRLGLHVGGLRRQGRRHDHLLLARRPASRRRSATSRASR